MEITGLSALGLSATTITLCMLVYYSTEAIKGDLGLTGKLAKILALLIGAVLGGLLGAMAMQGDAQTLFPGTNPLLGGVVLGIIGSYAARGYKERSTNKQKEQCQTETESPPMSLPSEPLSEEEPLRELPLLDMTFPHDPTTQTSEVEISEGIKPKRKPRARSSAKGGKK